MSGIFKNLASAMLFNAGSPMGHLNHAATEAYIANLSEDELTITALLPDDAEQYRSLVFTILDQNEANPGVSFTPKASDRERTLKPGEVAQLALKKVPAAGHTSLFRVRKQGQAESYFLKYTVEVEGAATRGAITFVGTNHVSGKLENIFPHLLYVW